jgi:hypothetical protein
MSDLDTVLALRALGGDTLWTLSAVGVRSKTLRRGDAEACRGGGDEALRVAIAASPSRHGTDAFGDLGVRSDERERKNPSVRVSDTDNVRVGVCGDARWSPSRRVSDTDNARVCISVDTGHVFSLSW